MEPSIAVRLGGPALRPFTLEVVGVSDESTEAGGSDELSRRHVVQLNLERVARPEDEATRSKQCDLWAYVWGSTAVLASLIVGLGRDQESTRRNPLPLAGLQILEIGAGSGVASLCAAKLGACVLTTDLVEDALALCRQNASRNDVPARTSSSAVDEHLATTSSLVTHALDWHRPQWPSYRSAEGVTVAKLQPGAFDLIIASDVLYMSRAVRPIAALCAAALRPGGAALFVDPGRPSAADLLAEAEDVGLEAYQRDVYRLRTAVCDMPKCSVFLVKSRPQVMLDGLGANDHCAGQPGVLASQTSVPDYLDEAWLERIAHVLAQRLAVADDEPFLPGYTLLQPAGA